MRSHYKAECLARAKALMEKNTEDSLVYAALELRQCIESIVYEKLNGYKKYVPGIVFSKWQPPHAMKTLLYFEPEAEESFKVAFALESSPGVTKGPFYNLGEHKALSVAWLSKYYNKLGSYLHIQRDSSKQQSVKELYNSLNGIIEKLDETIRSNISSIAIGERIEYKCTACKKSTLANAEAVRKNKRAYCINPNCGATHIIVEKKEGGWNIKLEAAQFKCLGCKTVNYIPISDLHVRMTFKCFQCSEKHIIIDHPWQYQTLEEYNDKKAVQ